MPHPALCRLVLLAAATLALAACGAARQASPQRFALAAAPASAPAAPDPAAQALAAVPAIERLVEEELTRAPLPSVSLGVVAGGRLIWARGYGARVPGGPAPDAHTVYRLGSVTKLLTGIAVLQLRDAGRLELDRPAADYLPGLSRVVYPTRDSPAITVRHLVTHTSGLPRVGRIDYTRTDRDLPEAAVLAALEGLPLEFAPGTRQSYSNLAMGLAGLLIERVTGVRYRTYVTDHILAPLGMHHSYWDQRDVPAELLATGHHRQGDAFTPVARHWRMGAVEAAGGLYASLVDLARLAAYELEAWPPRDAPERGPLRRAALRESHLPAGPGHGEPAVFGVNWGVAHPEGLGHLVAHTGSTVDYSADIRLLPARGVGVVGLTGCGEADRLSALATRILKLVAEKVPVPEPALGPAAAVGLERVLALIARPEPAAVERAFEARAGGAAAQIVRVLEEVRRLGPCARERTLRADGLAAAHVRLRCGAAAVDLRLTVQTDPPHLLQGLGLTPAR